MRRLQAVQNAAARLITGTSRRDHITPVPRQLQWLPVRHRAEFKLAVLVFKALHGLAPQYRLMTANSSLPLAAVNYDRQTSLRASSNAPALVLAIDHSQSLDHVCGSVYLPNFVIPPFPSDRFVER